MFYEKFKLAILRVEYHEFTELTNFTNLRVDGFVFFRENPNFAPLLSIISHFIEI